MFSVQINLYICIVFKIKKLCKININKYQNKMEKKKYKRKQNIKKTMKAINEIKNSVPKIIFKAHNIVVTLKNKAQLNKWLQLYPEGTYKINY